MDPSSTATHHHPPPRPTPLIYYSTTRQAKKEHKFTQTAVCLPQRVVRVPRSIPTARVIAFIRASSRKAIPTFRHQGLPRARAKRAQGHRRPAVAATPGRPSARALEPADGVWGHRRSAAFRARRARGTRAPHGPPDPPKEASKPDSVLPLAREQQPFIWSPGCPRDSSDRPEGTDGPSAPGVAAGPPSARSCSGWGLPSIRPHERIW